MEQALSPSVLLRVVREWVEASEALSSAWLLGEVTNHSRSAAGHQYFTLRDDQAGMRMVLFRGDDQGTIFATGDRVFVHGRVSIYEPRGELQFICDFVRHEGAGLLAAQFEELRQRLEHDGLFEPTRKRSLPPYPRKIGLVTSPTGAALQDIRNVLTQRWPLAEVVLSPTVVQGQYAPQSIARAIDRLSGEEGLDLAIVARGGGSSEDLSAFSDEAVARAVFGFPVPVVTGVGHDTDVSIVDFVADVHAPTPSAAAERATPSQPDVIMAIDRLQRVMRQDCLRMLRDLGEDVDDYERGMRRSLPDPARQQNDVLRLLRGMHRSVHRAQQRATEQGASADAHLRALSPMATLSRGYAIVQKPQTRKVVKSTRQVKAGERLMISVADGGFATEVS